jgi:NADH dehydrogenase (ubiquinone) Fe-S protein 6
VIGKSLRDERNTSASPRLRVNPFFLLDHGKKQLPGPRTLAIAPLMHPPLETTRVTHARVACDGATDIPGGAALGHPRVWLQIDETGYVDCGYCDRRFILVGGAADGADQSTLRDHGDGAGR